MIFLTWVHTLTFGNIVRHAQFYFRQFGEDGGYLESSSPSPLWEPTIEMAARGPVEEAVIAAMSE